MAGSMTALEQLRVDWFCRYLLAPQDSEWERICLSIVERLDDMLEMEQAA